MRRDPDIFVEDADPHTFSAMLLRAAKRFAPATIIDVGASDGRWAEMAHEVWPKASLLLIEANPIFTEDRKRRMAAIPHHCAEVLAGRDEGSNIVHFLNEQPFQGVPDALPGETTATVKRFPIDAMTARWPGPYLVKLDIHGREHDVLAGARETLRNTVGLVMELYMWAFSSECWRALDMLAHVEKTYDFLPADLCEPLYRPSDGRLGQIDMLFEPRSAAGMNTPRWA